MKILSRIICLAILCFSVLPHTQAQVNNYPVNILPVLYPPFPASLKALYNSSVPKLVITITNKTLNNQVVNAKLAVSIKNSSFNAVSKPGYVNGAPIILPPGGVVRLTNIDMAPLYALSNLTGITQTQYENALPLDKTTFGFMLYDALTGKQISDASTYTVVYVLNQPPSLLFPDYKASIVETGMQNVNFQWMPRTTFAANAIKYIFDMVELLDSTQDPQAALLTNRLFFRDSTFLNTYLYGIDKPPLVPGKSYAWRVRVVANDNGDFNAITFQNDGYSLAGVFKYSADCKAPTMVAANDIDGSSATISWASVPTYSVFNIFYYPYASGSTSSKTVNLTNSSDWQYFLAGLPSNTDIAIIVQAVCDNGKTASAQPYRFTTLDSAKSNIKRSAINASCGTPAPKKTLATALLPALKEKDVLTISDFPIVVNGDVTGQNGIFSGTGVAEIWMGKTLKIPVSFTRIKVSSNYEVLEGTITPNN